MVELLKLQPLADDPVDQSIAKTVSPLTNFSLTHINLGKYDLVDLGKVRMRELEAISHDEPLKLKYNTERVAIENFVARCYIPGYNNLVVYYRTFYANFNPYEDAEQSRRQHAKAAIIHHLYDAYICNDVTRDVVAIMNIVSVCGPRQTTRHDPKHSEDCRPFIHDRLCAIDKRDAVRMLKTSHDGTTLRDTYFFLCTCLYALVQQRFAECPEVFIEAEQPRQVVASEEGKAKKPTSAKRNKQTVIKKIYTYQQPSESTPASAPRTINNPYYSVRGHYRHYKSGKIVWVKPYVKGSERHNPDYLVPKDYVMPKTAESADTQQASKKTNPESAS